MVRPSRTIRARPILSLGMGGTYGVGGDASDVSIVDAGDYYEGDNVELALQEIAAKAIGYQAHGTIGATEEFDAAIGWHSGTLDQACTFTLTANPANTVSALFLELAQDGTGGWAITLPAEVVNAAEIEADQDTTASETTFLALLSRDGGTTWYGGWWGGATGSALTVGDGTTTVSNVDTITFDGATVTDDTGGDVTVTVVGGGAAVLEYDYVEKTSTTNVTATTEATADTIVTGSALTFDGSTAVMIEFFSASWRPATDAVADRTLTLTLYDGSSSIGIIGQTITPAQNDDNKPVHVMRRLTPSAASHTYSIRGYVTGSTGVVSGGAGGAAAVMPAFIRITKATDYPLDVYTKTADPAVTDDAADGYSAGSEWLNTTTRTMWRCLVATTGAAIWHPIINPIPSLAGFAANSNTASTSLAITTVAFAVGANLICVCASRSRKPDSVTQTNVTWTERYNGSGNSQHITVYTGVVAGGSSGTTATLAFTGSNNQHAEIYSVVDSPLANFTAATAAGTGTASSTQPQLATSITTGGYYIWAISANNPTSSYMIANIPYRHHSSALGGQLRLGTFRAQGTSSLFVSIQSSSADWFMATIRLT